MRMGAHAVQDVRRALFPIRGGECPGTRMRPAMIDIMRGRAGGKKLMISRGEC